jgi:uncharacterized membrane protein YeaQ/YmgE (transglycosylase-associated protein family)
MTKEWVMTLANQITIAVGNHVWTVGMNVVLYIVIAAIVGVIAEFITGWSVPFGLVGAIIAGVIGIWLLTKVIVISGIGDYDLFGVPLLRAIVGAIIFILLWHTITSGLRPRRRRYRAA